MFTLRKTLKPSSSAFRTAHRLIATGKLSEPASSAAYDDLIQTAGRKRDLATVRSLLDQRYAKGFFTTNNTFKFISTDLSLLTDLLKTLSDLNERYCRKKSYESLISRLCKMQLADEALRVAEAAVAGKSDGTDASTFNPKKAAARESHCADAVTFHPILSLLTRKKNFHQAWRVVEIMKANNVARDVTCYNFFITSYSVAGDLKSSIEVLKKMVEEGLNADARTYDALVLGACKMGKIDGAMAILKRMVEDGVETMYSTYAQVILNLVKLNYCTQAVKFVMSYAGKDKNLDSYNFGLLATRLIAMNKVDEAKCVLEDMVKRDLDMGESLQLYYSQNVKKTNSEQQKC